MKRRRPRPRPPPAPPPHPAPPPDPYATFVAFAEQIAAEMSAEIRRLIGGSNALESRCIMFEFAGAATQHYVFERDGAVLGWWTNMATYALSKTMGVTETLPAGAATQVHSQANVLVESGIGGTSNVWTPCNFPMKSQESIYCRTNSSSGLMIVSIGYLPIG